MIINFWYNSPVANWRGVIMNTIFAAAFAVLMNANANAMMPEFTDSQEIHCLATNMYWEARNQSTRGQMAVGHVTMNRVKDDRFPNTVCEVVMQGPTRPSWKDKTKHYPVRNRCQFSWYCDGKADKIPEADEDLYQILLAISFKLYYNQFRDFTGGATHYHADYVSPEWRHTKTKTFVEQNHIFYRWEKI